MKSISTALAAHLAQGQTTLTYLWKVKRTDGTILGFTPHDRNIAYTDGDGDAVTYLASTGFVPTANAGKSDLSVDNIEVTGFLESESLVEADLRGGLYDDALIEIRLVNWADLTMGDMLLRSGTLGVVKMQNGLFHAELRGLTYKLTTVLGALYGPTCRAQLGSGDPLDSVWIQSCQAQASGSSDLPLSASFTQNVRAGNRALVFLCTYDLASGPTISDSQSSTYTLLASQASPSDHGVVTCAVYMSSALSAGSLTITVSGSAAGSNSFASFIAAEATGLTGAVDGTPYTVYQDTGTIVQGLLSTANANDLVLSFAWIDLLAIDSPGLSSWGQSATTQIVFDAADGDSYQQIGVSFQVASAAGSFPAEWTSPQNSKAIAITIALELTGSFAPPTTSGGDQYLCHVDLSKYIQNGSVASVTDGRTLVPTSGLLQVGSATPTVAAPAGWFNNGILTFTSGVNDGYLFEIKTWDGTTLELYLPMQYEPSPGDTFTIEPGCDHTVGDCFNKFNNIINFRGEPFMPGEDAILQYGNLA